MKSWLFLEVGIGEKMAEPVEKLIEYCHELKLGNDVIQHATKIMNLGMQLKEKKFRKCPHCGRMGCSIRDDSIISASIYIASILTGERRSQKDIADVVGVVEMTIRKTIAKIIKLDGIKEIDKEIPDVFSVVKRGGK